MEMKLVIYLIPFITLVHGQSTPADTASGRACILPFKYLGVEYTSCTRADDSQCWCPLSLDKDGEPLETEACASGATCANKQAGTASAPATSGCATEDNKFCKFPYKYSGKTYSACITLDNGGRFWCATSVDPQGNYENYANCKVDGCKASSTSNDESFSYFGATGPDYWGDLFNSNCDLERQSPINIETTDAPKASFKTLTLTNYDQDIALELFQNGHTVQMNYVSGPKPTITGGPLGSQVYTFAQWHLHWGKSIDRGSEHTIDSKRYPMEIHLVHYNNIYGSLGAAVNEPDGLAVIGIMFDSALDAACTNSPLNKYKTQLANVNPDRSKTSIPAQKLNEFIKIDTSKFYNYLGSLTTPPCSESVTWIVMSETDKTKLCQDILNDLNAITDSKSGKKLYDNWRPVQGLNDRMAVKSF